MRRRAISLGLAAVLIGMLTACGSVATGSDLRTGTGQRAVVDAFIAATGQSRFTELGFLADHATALAPTKPGATTLDLWNWRDGRATDVGPESADPDDAAALFDAHGLDFGQVRAAVRAAARLTGMPVDRQTHVVVQRTFAGGDGAGGLGPPTIEVLFDDGHRDAHVSYDFDLTLVEKGGSALSG